LLLKLATRWGDDSLNWLLNFAQVFGLPLRWATYDADGAAGDGGCALRDVTKDGQCGLGGISQWDRRWSEGGGAEERAETPQGDLLDRADKQCDLLVLGQTLTTDTGGMGHGGGSHALGRVHAEVRSSVIEAAAKFAAGVIEQQLVPAILRLNYR